MVLDDRDMYTVCPILARLVYGVISTRVFQVKRNVYGFGTSKIERDGIENNIKRAHLVMVSL
jgi:hypothetical protein